MANDISSGGLNAVLSTMKHANEKAGLLRSSRALLAMNNPGGFDCPGCAWPEPKDRARFEFCENGAKALMNAVTTKIVDRVFFGRHSVADLLSWSDYQLSNCGRITEPMVKKPHDTHFQPISYEKAYELCAREFKKLAAPDRAVFYTSGRASNEAAFLYQLFARMLGTNNLCDCSNLCHESSGVALKKTIGIGKGTVQIEDFLQAEVIFLIGHNPSTNHPRMLTTLRDARKNGASIVVINPLLEPGLKKFRHPQKVGDLMGAAKEIATHYFQVKVGGDHALFTVLAHALLFDKNYGDVCDHNFIETHTEGFAHFKASLKECDVDTLIERCGLTRSDINAIATLIQKSKRVIYAWGMGITQTTYGVATIEAIVNLALMRGHLGQSGSGLCPVRGHSNVQGNRTVGITEKPHPSFLSELGSRFGFHPPKHHGLDVVDSIKAMAEQKVDVIMTLGGNFLSASPDTAYTTDALKRVKLAINISTSLNRTHLLAGQTSLIFPTLTRVEKDAAHGREQVVTVENSMSIVHASRGNLAPIKPDIPSEIEIIANVANRTLKPNKRVPWEDYRQDYSLIRDRIADCLPEFANYNNRIKNRDGFLLNNPASSRVFLTASKKAKFSPAFMDENAEADSDLLLTTIRSHDQFNTAIYGLDDRYRGIKGERHVIFMSAFDIKRLGLKKNMFVDLESRYRGVSRRALKFRIEEYDIKPGSAAAYFPEANVLVPLDSVALESNTPTSKRIPIFVTKSLA